MLPPDRALSVRCRGAIRSPTRRSRSSVRVATAFQSMPSPRRGAGRPSSTMCSRTDNPGTTESATGSSGIAAAGAGTFDADAPALRTEPAVVGRSPSATSHSSR